MTKTRNIPLVPLRLSLGLLGAGLLAASPQLASAGSGATVPTVPSSSTPSSSAPSSSTPSVSTPSSSVPTSSVPVDVGIPVPGQPTQRQFVLGEAATAVFDTSGGRLTVVTIAPHPGWQLVGVDEDDNDGNSDDLGEFDLTFRSAADVWVEFDVDATAAGGVTVVPDLCDDGRDDDRDGRDDRDDCDDDRRHGSGPSSTIADDHGGRGDDDLVADDHGGRGSGGDDDGTGGDRGGDDGGGDDRGGDDNSGPGSGDDDHDDDGGDGV